jgi:nucleoside-diphosphate-sugar epimerase
LRILITGASGFIGSALACAAHAQGHQVIGIDQSEAGRTLPDGVELIEADITRPARWRDAFEKLDLVIHTAAIHHTDKIAEGPIRSIEVNLRGTRLMLAMAAASGVAHFINLSSAKVYGEPLAFPSSEDDLLNPVEPYGLAKVMGEEYCKYYARHGNMRCVSVRPFSVYGPGQDLGTGYIGQLIDAWLSRRPTTIPGKPEFLRDFIHVNDVVDLCLAAARVDHTFDVINAGSGRSTSLRDLISEFAMLCGNSIDVRYSTARAGTIERTLADIGRELPLLGRPPTTLRDGLLETIQWFGKARSDVA